MIYKCDIKIMGCAARKAKIRELAEKLGLSFKDCAIDWWMQRNPLWTSMLAFHLPHEEGVTHRLVIQDDIDVAGGLADLANLLVNELPEAVFSLYCQTKKLLQYEDGSIIKTGGAVHGPGIIMPLKYVEDIYNKWQDRCPSYTHDDRLYSRYFNQHKIPVYTTVPNVVKLLDFPSELKHNGMFHDVRADLGDAMRFDWKVVRGSLGKPAEKNDIKLV